MSGGGWRAVQVTPQQIHVVPILDQIRHEVRECVCGPRGELIRRNDGLPVMMYTHHSLDGRELSEGDSAA